MTLKKICPVGRCFSALNPLFHAPKQLPKVSHGSTGKIAPVSIAFLSSRKDDLGCKNDVLRSKSTHFPGRSFAISDAWTGPIQMENRLHGIVCGTSAWIAHNALWTVRINVPETYSLAGGILDMPVDGHLKLHLNQRLGHPFCKIYY
jgi:hypothetical protein